MSIISDVHSMSWWLYYLGNLLSDGCHKPGQCLKSPLLKTIFNTDENRCIEKCQETEDCEWSSLNLEYDVCSLFSGCTNLDTTECSKCFTNKKACKPTNITKITSTITKHEKI